MSDLQPFRYLSGRVQAASIADVEDSVKEGSQSASLAACAIKFASLTGREKEVVGLVTAGLLNKQIAAELDISEVTVKMHRGNIMRKMQARSLADLVRMADLLGVSRSKPAAS